MYTIKQAYCKYCKRLIVWIRTTAGKYMPCDPDPIPYWNKANARGKIITVHGRVISCDFYGDGLADGEGYVPHFATCPKNPKERG